MRYKASHVWETYSIVLDPAPLASAPAASGEFRPSAVHLLADQLPVCDKEQLFYFAWMLLSIIVHVTAIAPVKNLVAAFDHDVYLYTLVWGHRGRIATACAAEDGLRGRCGFEGLV